MEEISKENVSISKPEAKAKKERSQKQIDAFQICVEKRKQKILEKKQGNHANEIKKDVSDESKYKALTDQIELLKSQFKVMRHPPPPPSPIPVQASLQMPMPMPMPMQMSMHTINENENENDNDAMEVDRAPSSRMAIQHQQQQQQHQQNNYPKQPQQQVMFRKRDENVGGYGAYQSYSPLSQSNTSAKRDIRAMDQYIDEKQGMMERIYTRNVNNDRQRQMEEESNRYRSSNVDSIQLLSQTNSRVDVDRNAPVENMKNMIRSTQFTSGARKQNAVAFNGYRVASRLR